MFSEHGAGRQAPGTAGSHAGGEAILTVSASSEMLQQVGEFAVTTRILAVDLVSTIMLQ